MRRFSHKRNRFSLLLPAISILAIALFSILSSFSEKSWSFNWSEFSRPVKDSIKVIAGEEYPRGFSFMKMLHTRSWIMKNATEDELFKLIDYPHGFTRAIAYEGLIRKQEFKDKTNLLIQSMTDNEYKVYLPGGCEGAEFYISEYLILFLSIIDKNDESYLKGLPNKYGITKNEIDSILEVFNNKEFNTYRIK